MGRFVACRDDDRNRYGMSKRFHRSYGNAFPNSMIVKNQQGIDQQKYDRTCYQEINHGRSFRLKYTLPAFIFPGGIKKGGNICDLAGKH
jgi:hypothetical protein